VQGPHGPVAVPNLGPPGFASGDHLGARRQHDDVAGPRADHPRVGREVIPQDDVLHHCREAGCGVAVRGLSGEPVAQGELGFLLGRAGRVGRARPETIIRRNKSPRTCMLRGSRSASIWATVDFPAAMMPVITMTIREQPHGLMQRLCGGGSRPSRGGS
jgi:hypothetical protein